MQHIGIIYSQFNSKISVSEEAVPMRCSIKHYHPGFVLGGFVVYCISKIFNENLILLNIKLRVIERKFCDFRTNLLFISMIELGYELSVFDQNSTLMTKGKLLMNKDVKADMYFPFSRILIYSQIVVSLLTILKFQ